MEALGQRLELLVFGRLPRRMQRGQRAAVERAERRDDDVLAWTTRQAGELDGAFVGFGSRIAEEHLPAAADKPVES